MQQEPTAVLDQWLQFRAFGSVGSVCVIIDSHFARIIVRPICWFSPVFTLFPPKRKQSLHTLPSQNALASLISRVPQSSNFFFAHLRPRQPASLIDTI